MGQKQTFAPQKVMSALPPKADMCGAARDVRYGPEADIGRITRSLRRLRLIVTAARQDQAHEPTGHLQSAQGTADVRSWSKVDISQRKRHVRFTPD